MLWKEHVTGGERVGGWEEGGRQGGGQGTVRRGEKDTIKLFELLLAAAHKLTAVVHVCEPPWRRAREHRCHNRKVNEWPGDSMKCRNGDLQICISHQSSCHNKVAFCGGEINWRNVKTGYRLMLCERQAGGKKTLDKKKDTTQAAWRRRENEKRWKNSIWEGWLVTSGFRYWLDPQSPFDLWQLWINFTCNCIKIPDATHLKTGQIWGETSHQNKKKRKQIQNTN